MTDSLRDQLLKLGFKKPDPPARAPTAPPRSGNKSSGNASTRHAADGSKRNAPSPQPARPQPTRTNKPAQVQATKPGRSQEEIDLARAYAIRDRQEREERDRARRDAEARAKERRERRLQLRALLQGKGVNDPDADLMRHFPHAGKIKRVHVNAEQLQRLNAGELGVVQSDGHYLLVDRETALAVRAVFAEALLLLPEPGEAVDDDWNPVQVSESTAT